MQPAMYTTRDRSEASGISEEGWLAGWVAIGWVPGFDPPYRGVLTDVGGVERKRWAFVREEIRDGLRAAQESVVADEVGRGHVSPRREKI